ncbi:MAG: histidinol-phosphatase [Ardenticatenia bacterium]|nr:MAG: histidinol-phosphatase [Ardenticatenia bacterium]
MTALDTLLAFALDAAWEAGRLTLGYFQTNVHVETKADASPVTIADREAEALLRRLIERTYPDHGIIGEEHGEKPARSAYTWVLDPIDGTKSFITGVPLYGTMVALLQEGEPVLGVLFFPALGEMVYAARGMGCFWNGRRARVSDVRDLSQAKLLVSNLNKFEQYGKADAWQRLVRATAFQRTWGDAYGYALVATGRADIMCDPIMSIWDIAPLLVIMEEAGGTLTDWQGNRTISNAESIATNGHLFEQVMALTRAPTT